MKSPEAQHVKPMLVFIHIIPALYKPPLFPQFDLFESFNMFPITVTDLN